MKLTRRNLLVISAAAVGGVFFGSPTAFAGKKRKSQPMEEKQFWEIIQMAKATAGNDVDARPAALERQLLSLDLSVIQGFQDRYDHLILRANRWDLWGAAYLMNGGCSDDGFRYFRDWLISEGRDVFENALSNPDSLATLPRRDYFDLELFGYVARKIFAEKGGGELEPALSVELAAPSGKEWSEPELPSLFPRLAAKYLAK